MKGLKVFFISAFTLVAVSFPSWAGDRQAAITRIQNRVEAKVGATWLPARLHMSLYAGNKIRTGANSKAQLMYTDGTVTRLGSQTILTVQGRQINLNRGKIFVRAKKGGGGLKVRTPSAVAAVTGTEFTVEVASDNSTVVTVIEGSVNVMGEIGTSLQLDAGNSSMVMLNQPPANPVPVNIDEYKQKEEIIAPIDSDQKESAVSNTSDPMPEDTPDKPENNNTTVVTTPTNTDSNKLINAPLNSDNPVKPAQEDVRKPEQLNTSPTTGELEIIIK